MSQIYVALIAYLLLLYLKCLCYLSVSLQELMRTLQLNPLEPAKFKNFLSRLILSLVTYRIPNNYH